jgi:hypothetical protein
VEEFFSAKYVCGGVGVGVVVCVWMPVCYHVYTYVHMCKLVFYLGEYMCVSVLCEGGTLCSE